MSNAKIPLLLGTCLYLCVCDNVSVIAYRGCPNGNLRFHVTCVNLYLGTVAIVAHINCVLF